jgi:hypothetical protein
MSIALKIYSSLWQSSNFPKTLEVRFDNAVRLLAEDYSQIEIDLVYKISNSNIDIEAVEIASRFLKRNPFLIICFQLMIYLAETEPQCRKSIINQEKGIIGAYFIIVYSIIRTIYKFLKGILLLRSLS